jgi:flagellar assembly protein FliH
MRPAKFLFDTDFSGRPEAKTAEPTISVREHTSKLAQAESAAYRNGFAAAESAATAASEQRLDAALNRIADGLSGLLRGLATLEARVEAEAVEIAVATARKLAPELIAREPLTEIAALVTECFRQLVNAPHVVIRMHDAQLAAAREQFEQIARASGFEGRLVILGEPQIAPGDCRIEWADGGIIRDRAAAERAIGEVVGRYVNGRSESNAA